MIRLQKIVNETKFHNPLKGFALTTIINEMRFDPLTGQRVRIMPMRNHKLPRHDWTPFVEESQKRFCPFCPGHLEKATPRFPDDMIPSGRLKAGQSVVVPNLTPYEIYAAVAVMCPDHYIAMDSISQEMIMDSFRAALEFLKVAEAYDPRRARYGSISWNYMPYSGGSIIHPHLQILSGPEPCRYDAELISHSAAYLNQYGRNFWADLLEYELDKGERYLGRVGNTHWLATFAPRALCDITAILPNRATVADIEDQDLRDMAAGLQKVIRYYDQLNIASFNATLYTARSEDNGFWATVRIVGRYTIFPLVGSDYSHLQVLHDEPWTLHVPEEMAAELKEHFKQ
ncbi:hypothetical protein GFC01_09155 [Desulfofundulus thermobenzoicus]|uniref:Galactose-1-phosphate uridylyltransferase n=1 Tax=Desulfofundulus thermobenzoicus TaxID=29376 RepID=A0A6N7ITK3_9FIRM|nr:hypothetical protein [Desulfofundulus thermobenzoicus]MQL52428.1 hypothetical protein [Desulfofundulus thermobenzoicus]